MKLYLIMTWIEYSLTSVSLDVNNILWLPFVTLYGSCHGGVLLCQCVVNKILLSILLHALDITVYWLFISGLLSSGSSKFCYLIIMIIIVIFHWCGDTWFSQNTSIVSSHCTFWKCHWDNYMDTINCFHVIKHVHFVSVGPVSQSNMRTLLSSILEHYFYNKMFHCT